jgi:hypothetical protein
METEVQHCRQRKQCYLRLEPVVDRISEQILVFLEDSETAAVAEDGGELNGILSFMKQPPATGGKSTWHLYFGT